MTVSERNPGRDALIAWAAVAALVTVLVQIDVKLPAIGHLGSALVAVVFIYTPVAVAWRRKEDLEEGVARVRYAKKVEEHGKG